VESEQLQMDTAGTLKEITSALGIPFVFKSSFDKANRTGDTAFRGLGMDRGLEILARVKREIAVPVLTDIHAEDQIRQVTAVVDVLQTPAAVPPDRLSFVRCARSGNCRSTSKRGSSWRPAT
jgi:2-dehydro-3-deoxyphosphooctonate aldolase (KDO 8-P synthase)